MERVSPQPPSDRGQRCAVCEAALEHDRCGHCGAAVRAGPYVIKRLLSQNPQGRVYLAVDGAGAEVALKELVYTMVPSAEELDAFTRETALLAQLEHPRIPRFVRGFTVGSGAYTRLYLAQELVRGESLEQRLAHHRFDEDEVVDIARQVLEVLAWLDERRPPIVHRDVKPANLILSAEGQVHLVDFGAARDVNSGGTHRSTLVGTVGYMAPEQLGGTVSHRSDLYGLGATLARLLTRQPPETLVGSGLAVDPQRVDASPRLRAFLAGLLAARPEHRFTNARAALEALDSRRVPARASRKPLLLAIAASAVLALAAGTTFFARRDASTRPAVEGLPRQLPPRLMQPLQQEPAQPAGPTEVPPADLPPTADEQPKVRLTNFEWELAEWDFSKPGSWVLDMTGHRHSGRFPRSGYSIDFFGPVWDGTSRVEVADSDDFVLSGPFSIGLSIGRPDKDVLTGEPARPVDPSRVEHLITRGEPNGRYAFDVSIQGDTLSFTLMDAEGRTSTVKGRARLEGVHTHFYAVFDPRTGDQWLLRLGDCAPVAHAVTDVRPAATIPGGKLYLVDGFVGRVGEIKLQRGLQKPQRQDGKCGLVGSDMTVR